jgi:hypothetical protein
MDRDEDPEYDLEPEEKFGRLRETEGEVRL